MKLILTTNDGEVLDSISISAAEYRQEVRLSVSGYLAALTPGEDALNADDTPEQD